MQSISSIMTTEVVTVTKDTPKVEAIGQAIEAGNIEEIKADVHRLKGSSAMIGAKKLSEAVRLLEFTFERNEIESSKTLFEQIRIEFERLQTFVPQPDQSGVT